MPASRVIARVTFSPEESNMITTDAAGNVTIHAPTATASASAPTPGAPPPTPTPAVVAPTGAIARVVAPRTVRRPREQRRGRRVTAKSGSRGDPSEPEPPRPLAAAVGRGEDSGLNVVLQAAYAEALSARECFEAAAILELRGEWLIERAA